jgi:hypothetical protein|tara:strand:- start:1198 stop:1359 length:162 start_codon:yes stop_codon:yes gene_type:complete
MNESIEITGNERIAFDNGKVEVDTGSNTLDFILILLLIMSIYAGKKLIDKWIK